MAINYILQEYVTGVILQEDGGKILQEDSFVSIDGDVILPALTAEGVLSIISAIRGDIIFPSLVAQGSLKVFIRRGLAIVWALTGPQRINWQFYYWMWARDAEISHVSSWALTAPIKDAWSVNYFGPRLLKLIDVVWSLSLQALFQAYYGLRVEATFGFDYYLLLAKRWTASWECLPAVQASWEAAFACCFPSRSAWTMSWGCLPAVQASWEAAFACCSPSRSALIASYASATELRMGMDFDWSLRSERLVGGWMISWDLADPATVSVRGKFRELYSLLGDVNPRLLQMPVIQIFDENLLEYPCEEFSLGQFAENGLWELSANLLSPPPESGTPITVEIEGDTYYLIVTDTEAAKPSPHQPTWRMMAQSLARDDRSLVDLELTAALHQGTAESIAAALAAPMSLDWQIGEDWSIDPPVAFQILSGLSRWAALQSLAQSAGASALVSPDGTTIVITRETGEIHTLVPLEISISDPDSGYGGVEICSHYPVATIDIVDESAGVKRIHVIPHPWRAITVFFFGDIEAQFLGEDLLETEETVEIADGIGSVSRSIHDVIELDPTDLNWRYDESYLWGAPGQYAAATIRYQTRALIYRVESPDLDPGLIIIEEINQ